MTTEKKILWGVGGVAAVVLLTLALLPSAKESFAPVPTAAHVAVQPSGADVARVGPVEIDAGEEFTLHAVLEARGRDGETVYYTEAPALEIDGERIADEALRPWDRDRTLKVFWFSVEGFAPFVKIEGEEQLDRFHFTEFFRAEWPSAWTIAGRLDPRFSDALAGAEKEMRAGERAFGTQRFQVRIELFADEDALTAEERFVSLGADALPEAVDRFPTIYAALPGPAGPASLAFGLTQLEPQGGASPELHSRLAALARQRLVFSRLPLIGQVIAASGRGRAELDWQPVDLEAGPPWGDGEGGGGAAVGTGDLVRAGSRVVVLFRDRGTPGRLDRDDLVFDYDRGAAVRALSEIFTGGGLVDVARL